MSKPIPVIVAGRQAAIAAEVRQNLLPEYEAIHVILSPAAGAREIPSLLRGETPPFNDTDEQVGTAHYGTPVAAVILGAAYDNAAFKEMHDACDQDSKVPWLRADMAAKRPPTGPGYGTAVVQILKVKLAQLKEDGEMGKDGVHYY